MVVGTTKSFYEFDVEKREWIDYTQGFNIGNSFSIDGDRTMIVLFLCERSNGASVVIATVAVFGDFGLSGCLLVSRRLGASGDGVVFIEAVPLGVVFGDALPWRTGDGDIGLEFTPGINSIGSVNLGSTVFGYAIQDGDNDPVQVQYAGGFASQSNPGAGWEAIGALESAENYLLYSP